MGSIPIASREILPEFLPSCKVRRCFLPGGFENTEYGRYCESLHRKLKGDFISFFFLISQHGKAVLYGMTTLPNKATDSADP